MDPQRPRGHAASAIHRWVAGGWMLLLLPCEVAGQAPTDTLPARTPPSAGSAEAPLALPTLVVDGARELRAKQAGAALAHRGLAQEALGQEAAVSGAVIQGASSLLYRDIPAIGTVYFRYGEPILFDTQESFTIESTFPSYHLRLKPVRSDALRPASDLALSLRTEVEDGVRTVVTPFRMESAVGVSRPGWRAGTSVGYRHVPGLLVDLLEELGAMGRGPRLHALAEVGAEDGNLLAAEGLVSRLLTDYRALFGFSEYDEDQEQGYLFLRGQRIVGDARVSLTTFRQSARTETESVSSGRRQSGRRTMQYQGGALSVLRGDSRVAVRLYGLDHADGEVERSFLGGQLDGEHTLYRGAGVSLNLTARLDHVGGQVHPSVYAVGALPFRGAVLEVGGGRLFDPLTPNRHGLNLLDLPGTPAALHQETTEVFAAVEGRLGGHTLRAQVQPRLIELPYLAHDLRVEGVTWRVSDRVDVGPWFASATLAIQQLEMVRDGRTGSFPATADQELKGVFGRDGTRISVGLATILRHGVQFPTRSGEVRDIGGQFIVNGSVTYGIDDLTLAVSGVNLTHWLGHRNHMGIVWKDDAEHLVEMPSWPNLSLQWRL